MPNSVNSTLNTFSDKDYWLCCNPPPKAVNLSPVSPPLCSQADSSKVRVSAWRECRSASKAAHCAAMRDVRSVLTAENIVILQVVFKWKRLCPGGLGWNLCSSVLVRIMDREWRFPRYLKSIPLCGSFVNVNNFDLNYVTQAVPFTWLRDLNFQSGPVFTFPLRHERSGSR